MILLGIQYIRTIAMIQGFCPALTQLGKKKMGLLLSDISVFLLLMCRAMEYTYYYERVLFHLIFPEVHQMHVQGLKLNTTFSLFSSNARILKHFKASHSHSTHNLHTVLVQYLGLHFNLSHQHAVFTFRFIYIDRCTSTTLITVWQYSSV